MGFSECSHIFCYLRVRTLPKTLKITENHRNRVFPLFFTKNMIFPLILQKIGRITNFSGNWLNFSQLELKSDDFFVMSSIMMMSRFLWCHHSRWCHKFLWCTIFHQNLICFAIFSNYQSKKHKYNFLSILLLKIATISFQLPSSCKLREPFECLLINQ